MDNSSKGNKRTVSGISSKSDKKISSPGTEAIEKLSNDENLFDTLLENIPETIY